MKKYGKDDYVLNNKTVEKVGDDIGATTVERRGEVVVLRTVTLRGWMHEKNNLGVETIRVDPTGSVRMDERQVLSTDIFTSIPNIKY